MKIFLFVPRINQRNSENRADYRSIRGSLLAMGHEVIDFEFAREIDDEGKEETLRKAARMITTEKPDLLFHGMRGDEMDTVFAASFRGGRNTISILFVDDGVEVEDATTWISHYDFVLATSKALFDACVAEHHENVLFAPWGCNVDLFKPIEIQKKYDLSFVGEANTERCETLLRLGEKDFDVRVWGEGWEAFPNLRHISHGWLPHHALMEVYGSSRIMLGLDGTKTRPSRSIFERAGCRTFQMVRRDPDLEPFYQESKDIACYASHDELEENVAYFLAHDEERERMALSAYEKTVERHSWPMRFSTVFSDINRRLSSTFPGGGQGLPLEVTATPRIGVKSQRPRVSLLCYTYNFGEYLDSLIPSVLRQTFKDFELLVLDDGSTDNTRDVVKKYAVDPRVRYVQQENMGQKGRHFDKLINKCLTLTSGELFSVVGGDDILEPNNLQRRVSCFDQEPGLDVLFHDATLIDGKGNLLEGGFKRVPASLVFERRNLLRMLFQHNMVGHPSALMTRACVDLMGGFELGFADDYHFWMKSAPFLNFKFLNEKLIRYRVHDKGASTGDRDALTVPGTVLAVEEARSRFSITDLFPEIESCSDKVGALYTAYVLAGNIFATGVLFQPSMALKEYERALQHNQIGIEALNNMALMCFAIGDMERARQVFARVTQLYQAPVVIRNHNLFTKSLTDNASTVDFQLLSEGTTPELARVIQELDRQKAEHDKSLAYKHVDILLEKGEHRRAAARLEELLEGYPSDSEIYNDLGFIYHKDGEMERAFKYVQRALQLNPYSLDAKNNMAALLLEAGRTEDALRVYEQIRQLEPDDTKTLLVMANLCAQQGLAEKAHALCDRVLALEPLNGEAMEIIALLENTRAFANQARG